MTHEIPAAPGEFGATPGDPLFPLPHTVKPDVAPSGTATPGRDPRPTDLDPEQMGFTPRRAVPWLSPVLLAGTAVRVVLADLFGAYLDKRELQSALPSQVLDEPPARSDEDLDYWFDFIADAGDGFNATYSMAYVLAQRELPVDGATLPRGEALVLGGDLVYPTASGQQYEDRFKGPYRAALPEPPPQGPPPRLYALPGNHDWYDGLTAFLRLFARAGHGRIGGWQTRQSRSYFAIKLPQRWWLYAIDTTTGAYLDDPQLRYFADAARQLTTGDRVILCTPTPSWVHATTDRQAYDTVDYFIRTVITPTGADVKLMLTGDLHHYARYAAPDRQLITCGGGGAYLYPTHQLPPRIEVPPRRSLVRNASPSREYELAATYPTAARSRSLAIGVFGRLPLRNPGFVALLGTMHTLLMLAGASAAQRMSGAAERLVTIPLSVMILLVLGGTILFGMPRTAGERRPRHWLLGLSHGAVQLGLAAAGTWIWLRSPLFDLSWPMPVPVAFAVYLPVVGLLSSQIVGLYLIIAGAVRVNVNELFAGQGIADLKCFLRLHIGRDGILTVYPVAVDRISRRWRAAPNAPADSSWFEPARPMPARLAEPPVRIG